MSIKAGGRVALIAAGLCVGVLGLGLAGAPSVAAPSQSENVSTAKTVKQVRYYKRYVNRKTVRASQKSSPTPKAAEAEIAQAVRANSPTATPNARLVAIADAMLGRNGRMVAAVEKIGRGCNCFEGAPFVLELP